MSAGLISIDRRSPADNVADDPHQFLTDTLPGLATRRWNIVSPALDWLALEAFEIVCEGRRYALDASSDGLDISLGDAALGDAALGDAALGDAALGDAAHAATSFEVTPTQLTDLANDEVTPMALYSSGQIVNLDGRLESLLDWWLVVRALVDDRPIHVPGEMSFTDAEGRPLDLGRSYSLDDDPAELNRFLTQCGYLHLRSVFSTELMDAVSADMDRFAGTYSPDDGNSWWAVLENGTNTLVRMQKFSELSDAARSVLDCDVLDRIASLTPDRHERKGGANPIEALFKPIGVRQGISDVPWHKDCALGRHNRDCCFDVVGISVTAAGPTSGQLKVVAGSHRALVWSSLLRDDTELPIVELPTEKGDVTVHLSCTLHMAQPPTEHERRVMYTTLSLPGVDDSDRRQINQIREAAPRTVSQPRSEA